MMTSLAGFPPFDRGHVLANLAQTPDEVLKLVGQFCGWKTRSLVQLGMARDIALHMGLQRLILEVERYIMLVKQVWQNQMRGTTITKVVEELDQVEDGYGSWLCVLMVISHA